MTNDVTIHVNSEDHTDMDLIGRKVEAKAKRSFLKVGGHAGGAFAAGFIKTITFGMVGSGFAQAATGMAPKMAHIGGVLGAGLAAGLVMKAVSAVGALLPLALGPILTAGPLIYLWKTQTKAVDRLKAKAHEFIDVVSRPLKAPFLRVLEAAGHTLRGLEKPLQGMMKALAPGFEKLAKGALGGIASFVKALEPAIPAITAGMKQWGKEFPRIGKAFGGMITKIMEDPKGTIEAVKGLATELRDLADAAADLAKSLSAATKAYGRFAKFIDKQEKGLGGDNLLLPKPATVHKQTNAVLKALTSFAHGTARRFGQVVDSGREMIAGFRHVGSRVVGAIHSMVSRGVSALGNFASGARNRFNQVVSAGQRMVAGIRSGMSRFVSAIRDGASRAISTIHNLISRIRGAFAGAGSWLVSAGRRIVQGLAAGIRGAIGAVTGAISGVIHSAIDFGKSLIPGHAAGGIIGAAGGGPRGGRVWVGEQGPELVDLPLGSHVNSNPDSMAMTGKGNRGSVHITINAPNYVGAPTDLLRALTDAKRRGQLDVLFR